MLPVKRRIHPYSTIETKLKYIRTNTVWNIRITERIEEHILTPRNHTMEKKGKGNTQKLKLGLKPP